MLLTTVVLGNLFRVLDWSTGGNVVQLSHDIVGSLNKIPDMEETAVDIGRGPAAMRLNG